MHSSRCSANVSSGTQIEKNAINGPVPNPGILHVIMQITVKANRAKVDDAESKMSNSPLNILLVLVVLSIIL
jgi:hypothetical protein